MKHYDIAFLSEAMNGTWSLLSLICSCVCAAYIASEWRHRPSPGRWSIGMSVAAAVMTLSIGSFISRYIIFDWRHFHSNQSFSRLQMDGLLIGANIGAAGYLMLIHMLSRERFGKWVTIASACAVLAFWAFEFLP